MQDRGFLIFIQLFCEDIQPYFDALLYTSPYFSESNIGFWLEFSFFEFSSASKKALKFKDLPFFAENSLFASNEHRIAKTEEPVFLLYRLLISGQHMLPSRQSGHQHNKRGLGQMEIGH